MVFLTIMSIQTRITSIIDHILISLWVIAGVVFVFSQLLVTETIFARMLKLSVPIWGIQVAEYCLLWITLLAAPWLLKKEQHVKIEFVLNKLDPRAQSLVTAMTSIMGAMVFLGLAWYSGQTSWSNWHIMDVKAAYIPKGPALSVIPIASFLLFVQFLRRAYANFRSWRLLPNIR